MKKTSLQNLAPNIYLQFTIFHWIILGTIAYPMFRTTHVRLWVPGTQRYSNTRDEFAGKHLTKRGTQIQLMPILEVWSIHSQSAICLVGKTSPSERIKTRALPRSSHQN